MVDLLRKVVTSLEPLAPITKDMLREFIDQQKLDKALYLTVSFESFEKAKEKSRRNITRYKFNFI